MAFVGAIGGDCKQRINISQYALNTVNDDMVAFGNNQFTNFINTVISNFKYDSDASISLVLEKEKNRLEEILGRTQVEQKAKNAVIKNLCNVKKQELLQRFSSYEKHISCPVRLWKETVEYLTDPYSDCKEELFYNGKVGRYLKAIIEDYASKPFCERELIYFSDRVTMIKKAIDLKKCLVIETSNKKIRIIYPCDIIKDSMSMYNYLIGYSKNETDGSRHPVSMRISGMADVKLKNTDKALKQEEIRQLNDAVRKLGVQFLLGTENEIRVILTEAGKRKFANQLHLRPNCIDVVNDNEYLFNCTQAQAEFYFIKFGKDAYIKEPESLRRRMAKIYFDAYSIYKD